MNKARFGGSKKTDGAARRGVVRGASGVALVIATVALVFGSAASAQPFAMYKQSMEGDITIQPGDWISGGYQITIPGSHPAATVALADAEVLLPVSCTNGGPLAGLIHIPMSAGPYNIPQNNSAWFPGANQASAASYQGAVQAPNLCSGGPMYNKTSDATYGNGASFKADLQSTQADEVHFQFHYRDPNAKGKGNVNCSDPKENTGKADVCGASWSATKSYPTDPYVPVPAGAIGVVGLAAVAGVGLVIAQRRRRGSRTVAASPMTSA